MRTGNTVTVKIALFFALLAFLAVGYYRVASSEKIVGEWILADFSRGKGSTMIIRSDGTGDISVEEFSRPFVWRVEGETFYFSPVIDGKADEPQVETYRLYDSNRYLALTTNGVTSTWRRKN